MTVLARSASILALVLFAGIVGTAAWWIVTAKADTVKTDKPAPPAKVATVVREEDLNTVTLTEEAEKRLGLTVGVVEQKAVRRVRVYGGEATIPFGRTILVAAPLGGTLRAPVGGMPKAGQSVKSGQPVLELLPILTPDGRATLSASLADADGQVNNAKTQVELTRVALERQVDEARAAAELAVKTLEAAAARRLILAKVVGDVEAGTAAPIAVTAPEDGLLRVLSALPGQTVPSGAALFEVVDPSTIWVRVALPVADLDAVDRNEAARVGRLSAPPETPLLSAKPAVAPPSANPLTATVDLFYELANGDGKLTPGQRLAVTLPLTDAKVGLTVPWSAVVFDVNGGTWVYERTDSRRYVRRRVVVSYTFGTDAVLTGGPAAGVGIVTRGTQQLFGAETGFGK